MHQPISDIRRRLARGMRRRMTAHEFHLWRRLREGDLGAAHFRRQAPIGPFIIDFASLARRIVVEVDGNQHGLPAQAAEDARRTEWLNARGFIVLRFSNWDVERNLEGVLESIYAVVSSRPPPKTASLHSAVLTSPQGGG